ncbi:hypothetical protein JCM10296v2_006475 [Rhodotorula toruloides]
MPSRSVLAASLLGLAALAHPVRAANDTPHSIETRKGPAIIAFVLFGAVFLVHCFQYIRNRRKGNKGMLTLIIGMFFMALGFLLRTSKTQYAWQFLLAIAGLILQVVSFAIFTFLLFLFSRHLRSRYPNFYASPESGSHNLRRPLAAEPVNDVRLLVRIVELTCIGFMIRSVFRLDEQCDGFFGTIASHEVFFYLFDTIPLLLSVALFGLVWPPRYIKGCALASEGNEMGESVDLQRSWK